MIAAELHPGNLAKAVSCRGREANERVRQAEATTRKADGRSKGEQLLWSSSLAKPMATPGLSIGRPCRLRRPHGHSPTS